jgi:hypothetical protein
MIDISSVDDWTGRDNATRRVRERRNEQTSDPSGRRLLHEGASRGADELRRDHAALICFISLSYRRYIEPRSTDQLGSQSGRRDCSDRRNDHAFTVLVGFDVRQHARARCYPPASLFGSILAANVWTAILPFLIEPLTVRKARSDPTKKGSRPSACP